MKKFVTTIIAMLLTTITFMAQETTKTLINYSDFSKQTGLSTADKNKEGLLFEMEMKVIGVIMPIKQVPQGGSGFDCIENSYMFGIKE